MSTSPPVSSSSTAKSRKATAKPWAPACMSLDEWAWWAAGNARVVERAPRPCSDCTAGSPFHLQAVGAGSCNGQPAQPLDDDDDEG